MIHFVLQQDRLNNLFSSITSYYVIFHSRSLFSFLMLQIFAGAFPENYEPPSGFYFEVNDASPVVQVIKKGCFLKGSCILQGPIIYFHLPAFCCRIISICSITMFMSELMTL